MLTRARKKSSSSFKRKALSEPAGSLGTRKSHRITNKPENFDPGMMETPARIWSLIVPSTTDVPATIITKSDGDDVSSDVSDRAMPSDATGIVQEFIDEILGANDDDDDDDESRAVISPIDPPRRRDGVPSIFDKNKRRRDLFPTDFEQRLSGLSGGRPLPHGETKYYRENCYTMILVLDMVRNGFINKASKLLKNMTAQMYDKHVFANNNGPSVEVVNSEVDITLLHLGADLMYASSILFRMGGSENDELWLEKGRSVADLLQDMCG